MLNNSLLCFIKFVLPSLLNYFIFVLNTMFLLKIILPTLLFIQSLGLTINDFLSLPTLIEHAQEHREAEGINFLEFVEKHYFSHEQHKHENGQSHEQLPLNHQAWSGTIFFLNTNECTLLNHFIGLVVKDFWCINDDFWSLNIVLKLFQPPRM